MTRSESLELPSRELEINGRLIDVRVRRSPRARHASVSVAPGALVEVVIPRRAPQRRVAQILIEKENWIRRQLDRLERLNQREPQLGLNQPGVVWLHGQPVTVETKSAGAPSSTTHTVRLVAGALVITGPGIAVDPTTAREDAVLRWYRREARQRIGRVAEREAERLGVVPGRLSIRDPRTRWGSCSSRATLSFSWRLLLAPFEVLDYVVVHELCHLRELNHSPSFWSNVERARPGYREQSAWLRQYGHELHDYRPVLASERAAHAVNTETQDTLF